MKKKTHLTTVLTSLLLCGSYTLAIASPYVWYDGDRPVTLAADTKIDPVVVTAMDMFSSDIKEVTGKAVKQTKVSNSSIMLTQLDRASKSQCNKLAKIGVPVEELVKLTDGFNVMVSDGKIYVTGSNGRGAAYGLLELSREAGVSPWIWWGDIVPQKKQKLELPEDYSTTQGASVEYRGIFINDEDWSLRPWSCGNFEPGNFGTIGPKTYKEIFKLLMRLRANTIWPAMHEGTEAFFKNPVNKLMADSCGIAVGSSHCEPLLRNNVGEWDVKERGSFNYMTNREEVHKYWTERLEEVKNSSGGNIFTIGMRGIHDSSMEGVSTTQEKFDALQTVINDQQKLIADHVGNPSGQMQVFVPYKEVLELYQMGLQVPDYVTLMWCDDNYGYITRLSTEEEQSRAGGGGVYYHMSYWGRPHDHLWLTTTQPGLIFNEMKNAYDHNVRKLWIGNVHDPKVAAYDLELFLDMAWNINSVKSEEVGEHLRGWLKTNFGDEVGEKVYPAMRKYYELCGKRKPEFMGWSQVELDKKLYHRGLSPVANTEFSFTEFGGEADRYMEEFYSIAKTVEEAEQLVDPALRDGYFAAVMYPVMSAANNAVKMIEAQRARSVANGGTSADHKGRRERIYRASARSQKAFQNLRRLTEKYNTGISDGKWNLSMNMQPRDLPTFNAPSLPVMLTDAEIEEWTGNEPGQADHSLNADGTIARAAASFAKTTGDFRVIDMLGHSGSAVELSKGSSLTYEFELADSIAAPTLTTALIPTQPNDDGQVRYSVAVDGGEPIEFDLKEPFRSDRWKENVLRGQARRASQLAPLAPGSHTLTITALDPHIVVDQWMIDPKHDRKYYLIPTM